jgi:molybdenum cofactor biosynthesis protein B
VSAPDLHRAAAPKALDFYVVTVSSSRYSRWSRGEAVVDEAGEAAEELIRKAGHRVLGRELVDDDVNMIRAALLRALSQSGAQVIVFTGGTGISPRDVTIEALRPLFWKELEGFGELLRHISYQRIGPAAALTRATAGTIGTRLVLCLPGSPDAVRTALEAFLPELPHAIHILSQGAEGKAREGG